MEFPGLSDLAGNTFCVIATLLMNESSMIMSLITEKQI